MPAASPSSVNSQPPSVLAGHYLLTWYHRGGGTKSCGEFLKPSIPTLAAEPLSMASLGLWLCPTLPQPRKKSRPHLDSMLCLVVALDRAALHLDYIESIDLSVDCVSLHLPVAMRLL